MSCTKIFNTISIQEANNAIRQGQSIKFISILATVFVPISLFSSLFGMNVQELGVQQGPAVRSFLLVALPSTTLVLVLAWFLRPLFAYVEHKSGWLSVGSNNMVQTETSRAKGNVKRPGVVSRLSNIDPREREGEQKKSGHVLWPEFKGTFWAKKRTTAPYTV